MTRITINGQPVDVEDGATVAVALLQAGVRRESVSGMPREATCGMGICWECRATVDGAVGVRTCLVRVAEGMEVDTRG
jgi:sarcosine oxidase subunit alpha